jgi:hypothetical protein
VHLLDIVPPTLAVVASWLCIAAFVAGVGHASRRGLLLAMGCRAAVRPQPPDLWIGLAALVAYLQIWNLGAAVSSKAWIVPGAAALVGVASGLRALRPVEWPSLSWPIVAGFVIAVMWLANRALAGALYYDLGLYHFGSIEYASRFAAIPGLGNLHGRLGAGNGHLLLVSFVDHGPLAKLGFHILNGLLAAFLLVDLTGRFVRYTSVPRLSSFTTRVALLLLPVLLVSIVGGKGSRINNPDLDFAAFVLVIVGMLYLVECLEFGFRATPALVAISSLSLAGTTRPLYWPLAVLAAAVLMIRRNQTLPRVPGSLVLLLPIVLVLGWMARQVVLSGYPLFPLTTGGLPVDWRMPTAAVHDLNRFVTSWARSPGDDPNVVLASWHWFTPWLRSHEGDLDLVGPLLLLGAGIVSALAGRSDEDRRRRRAWRTPMHAMTVPPLPLLVLWFFNAPDPRFATALLWLPPLGLLAWALPGKVELRSPAYGSLAVALLVSIGLVAHKGVFRPIVSNGTGPLGTVPVPGAAVVPFITSSRLEIFRPAKGELCWRVLLCTPKPNRALRLRGTGVGDGFRVGG